MEHRSLSPDLVVSNDDDACGNQRAGKPAPNVAPQELREEKQVGGPVNCSDSELCTFLAALEAGFLPTYYSDTSPSVQLRSMSIASRSYQRGRKTVAFHGFPSLQMSRNLTEDLGAELLKSWLAVFRARTSAPLEKAPESTASEAGFGEKWRELSVRYDPDTSSWRTHRCLWDEDLSACSLTLPKWGSMRDGVLSELLTLERPTAANDAGLWPTQQAMEATNDLNFTCSGDGREKPNKLGWAVARAMAVPTPRSTDWKNGKQRADFGMNLPTFANMWPTPLATDGSNGGPNQKGGKGDLRLSSAVHQFPTPTATNTKANHMRGADKGKPREARNYMATPTARDWRSGKASQATMERNSRPLSEQIGGQLNPNWVEWLMGWPPGWTDLKPLVMDRFRNAPLKHGGC